jgi:fatty-acyl-CoA synthase
LVFDYCRGNHPVEHDDEENTMTTARASESVLRGAYRPADGSAELVDLTVGALPAQRADAHAERPAIVGVRHDGSQARLAYSGLYEGAAGVATVLGTLVDGDGYIALWAPNVLE